MSEAVKDYYECKIKDLFLASYLCSLGFLPDIEVLNSDTQSCMLFNFTEVTQEIALSYFNETFNLTIDGKEYKFSPKSLFLAFRDLRQRVHQLKNVE